MYFIAKEGDYAVRSCDENFNVYKTHVTAAIVKFDDDGESTEALAYWEMPELTEEGKPELKFCGARPFSVDPILFMRLAKYGQTMLEDYHKYAQLVK